MSGYILALDQGTTSSRALIFDLQGNVVSTGQKEFTQYFPEPGWVEHDPKEIWSTTMAALKTAVSLAGISTSQILCAGIANQRETVLLWDKTTNEPLTAAIVWQCRRTAPYCKQLSELGHEAMIREKTGLQLDAYFSGTKIKWLLDNTPGARELAAQGHLAAGTVDSWLLYRLSGVHATDPSNASRTMLYNIHTQNWDPELLELFSIPVSVLPEIRPSAGLFGKISAGFTGHSIPITGIAGDQQAALFGQGCFTAGDAKNTYGTGCFLLYNTGTEVVKSANGLLTSVAWHTQNQFQYCLEGSVFTAGALIQWLRDSLGIIKDAQETDGLARSVQDSLGVQIVPAFVGLGAPYWDSNVRGTILGLTRGANKAHIVRAALESIGCQCAELLDCVIKDTGRGLRKFKVDGGGSRNDFLMQFQADILGVPVSRPANIETTAAGAAALAALGYGLFGSTQEMSGWYKEHRIFEPVWSGERRLEKMHQWKKAVAAARSYSS